VYQQTQLIKGIFRYHEQESFFV